MHDAVFELDAESRPHAHTRHLLNVYTVLKLADHDRLQSINLVLALLA